MPPARPIGAAAVGLVGGLLAAPTAVGPLLLVPCLLVAAAQARLRAPALGLALGLLLGVPQGVGPAPSQAATGGGPRLLEVEGTVEEAEPPHAGGQRLVLAGDSACDGAARIPFRARLALRWEAPGVRGVAPGDRVRAVLTLLPLAGPRNPGGRDERAWAWRRGIDHEALAAGAEALVRLAPSGSLAGLVHDLRVAAADRLSRALPPRDAGLARALLLGDRGALDARDGERFRLGGQGHLVAVSGQHVVLVLGAMLVLVRRLGAGHRTRLALGLATLALYVPLAGAAPSAVRSGLGAGLWLLARLASRRGAALELLAAAALAMLVLDPRALADPGFTLSFAAVLGIERLAPRMLAAIAPPRPRIPGLLEPPPPRVRAALCVATAAWLAGAPIALATFGQLAPAAAPLSLLTVPLAGLLLGLSALLLALATVPVVGAALAWGFAATADLLRHVLGWPLALGLEAQDATPPCVPWLALSLGLLVLAAEGPARLRRWALLLEAALLLAALVPQRAPPPAVPTAWALDTGRAPAVLLRLPDGRNALLGAGSLAEGDPVRRRVLPALRALGVRRLDLAWSPEERGPRRAALEQAAAALDASTVHAGAAHAGAPPGATPLLAGAWGRLVLGREGASPSLTLETPDGRFVLHPAPPTREVGALVRACAADDPGWRTPPAPPARGRYARARMPPPAPPEPAALALFVGALALFAALCVRPLDWLRPAGALGALVLGTLATASLGYGAFAALLAPFLVATALGRLPGRPRERGRSLVQVLANGLPALLGAAVAFLGAPGDGAALLVGGLACLGADTCATEIGTRYGGTPRALLGGRALAPGESGGVTLAGLLASAAGAWLAPLAYGALTGLEVRAQALLAAAGFAGALLDSLLGATLQFRGRDPRSGAVIERRRVDGARVPRVAGLYWLDNDGVNLVSGLAAALLGWAMLRGT